MTFACSARTSFLCALRFDRAALSVLRWARDRQGRLCQPDHQRRADAADPARAGAARHPARVPAGPARCEAVVSVVGKRQCACALGDGDAAASRKPGHCRRCAPPIRFEQAADRSQPACRRPLTLPILRGGIAAVRRIFAASPLQRAWSTAERSPGTAVQGDAALDDFIRNNLKITQHPSGTCRMGEDPIAVVDSELRVKGVAGLRVVDASVMPTRAGRQHQCRRDHGRRARLGPDPRHRPADCGGLREARGPAFHRRGARFRAEVRAYLLENSRTHPASGL